MKANAMAVLGFVLLGAGCATTRVTDSWKNPTLSQAAPVKQLMVVAVVPIEAMRERLELELVAQLAEEGITAVPSSKYFPPNAPHDLETIRHGIEGKGFDGLLVSQFTGFDTTVIYQDPYYRYGSRFDPGFDLVPSQFAEWAKMQTTLFDNRENGRVVGSVSTLTLNPDTLSKRIPSLADAIVKRLEKDGVLNPVEG